MKLNKLLATVTACFCIIGNVSYNVEGILKTSLYTVAADANETVDKWDGTVDTSWYDENKTQFDITTAEQLAGLVELNISGNTFKGKTIRLENNFNVNNTTVLQSMNTFEGNIGGLGHSITGLKNPFINKNTGMIVGISFVSSITTQVTSNNPSIGVIANESSGSIIDCNVSGSITCNTPESQTGMSYPEYDTSYFGGICGTQDSGKIFNCTSSVIITRTTDRHFSTMYIGGICGNSFNAEIRNCTYSNGTINATATPLQSKYAVYTNNVVSLDNSNKKIYYDCYCRSDNVDSKQYVGGICGNASSTYFYSCNNTGTINCTNKIKEGATPPITYNTGEKIFQYVNDYGNTYYNLEKWYRFDNTKNGNPTVKVETKAGGVCGNASFANFYGCSNSGTGKTNVGSFGKICGYKDANTIIEDKDPTTTTTTSTTTTTTTTSTTTTLSTTTTPTTTPHESTYQGLKYKTVNDEIFITGFTDDLPSVLNIPAKIGDIPVTNIGDSAFRECTNLKEITIPDSLTSIGNSAFRECTNLKEITIPDSVTSIGSYAFLYTPWLDAKRKENPLVVVNGILIDGEKCSGVVTIPGSVTSIGGGAFTGCTNLTKITIPDSVTSIGGSAFYYCTNLKEITIPDSVTSIGSDAFSKCTKLKEITIPDSVTSIGNNAFLYTPWLDAKRNENPLVVVNGILIDGKKCSGVVTIPDSVTSIGGSAFSQCTSLTKITIPDSVTSIGSGAFYYCTNLKEITIPDSVTSIESNAFSQCTSLVIKGYTGSYAETFANINRIPFESLGDAPREIMGDVNNDGSVSIADAVTLQNFLLGRTKTLGNWKNADLCKDDRLDVFDMVLMRRLLI